MHVITSYFVSYKKPLYIINYIGKKKHLNYHPSYYKTDHPFYKALRTNYVRKMNNWLNSSYEEYEEEYEEEYDEEYEEGYEEEYEEESNLLLKKDVCQQFHDKLISLLDKKGYTITNSNQFKEDIIYYLYRLSRIE